MRLQIKIDGGYEATEKMAKIHLKKLNLGAFLGRFGDIFFRDSTALMGGH